MTAHGSGPAEVVDVPDRSRFEILVGEAVAGFAVYRLEPGEITFVHTQVDDAYAGHGIGGTLARGALDSARARGLAVRPDCPFIRAWIERHPDYAELVV